MFVDFVLRSSLRFSELIIIYTVQRARKRVLQLSSEDGVMTKMSLSLIPFTLPF